MAPSQATDGALAVVQQLPPAFVIATARAAASGMAGLSAIPCAVPLAARAASKADAMVKA